jgi:hypothetical protein
MTMIKAEQLHPKSTIGRIEKMKDARISYLFHLASSISPWFFTIGLLELSKILFSQLTQSAMPILFFALGVAIVLPFGQSQVGNTIPFSTQSSPENAKSADKFIDTIGVNVHLNYMDRVYYQQFDNLIKPKLIELGMRYIRDGVNTDPGDNRNDFYYQRLRDLANSGIKFNLITSTKTDYSLLDDVYSWTNRAIVSFEGLNEPDDADNSNWAGAVRAAQKKLYKTVKGNSALRHLTVIAPSVLEGQKEVGDLSPWVNFGNLHNYFSGLNPEIDDWRGIRWKLKNVAEPLSTSKPVISTETGWDNALKGPHILHGVPEDVVGKYMPRMFLTQFNSGIARTYSYEFIDEGIDPKDPEANFGLLRNDGSPKPAYTALKNLINLLKDPGPSFKPGSLDYSLRGNKKSFQHTLLQKRNGDFYLAFWAGKSGWDPATKTRLLVPDKPISLTLPKEIGSVTRYTFNKNGSLAKFVLTPQKNQISLNFNDRITILKLSKKFPDRPSRDPFGK